MFGILGLVLVIAIVATVWATTQRQRPPADTRWAAPQGAEQGAPNGMRAESTMNPRLRASLDQWQFAGLIDQHQADAIAAFEAAAAAPVVVPTKPRRIPLVAEALGYLGGILGIVGLVLLISRYWTDMPTALRLSISIGGTLILTVGGLLVPSDDDSALERLRSFLWFIATAAGAVVAGVVAVDVFDAKAPGVTALACAATVGLHSALLWGLRTRPVQQLTCLAALPVAAGLAVSLAAHNDAAGATGGAVWAVGAAILLVGLAHIGTTPTLTLFVGAVAGVIGASITASDSTTAGVLLVVLTAVGIMLLAGTRARARTAADRVVLTVVGAAGLGQGLPLAIVYFSRHGGVATGLVVFAAGVALMLLADSEVMVAPLVTRLFGGAAIVGGLAVTGVQSAAFATVFGLVAAVALIAIGTLPERVLMSLFGSLGLLVNVPWAIAHFFPGEGRAPLLILVSGMLIVVVAVWLTRQGGRIRREFRHFGHT